MEETPKYEQYNQNKYDEDFYDYVYEIIMMKKNKRMENF